MALDKIQQSVTASARNEADHILKAAEQAARDRVAREVDVIRRGEEHRFQLASRAIDDAASRKLSQAKREASKQLLQRRNDVLEAIFTEATRQFLALPSDRYAAELARRLATAAGSSGGTLRVHADDFDLANRMLTTFNTGRDARVTLDTSAPLPVRGGFVFVADVYEVDQTVETIMNDLKHELGPQLAAELFPG